MESNELKILITGGCGYIGSHVAVEFLHAGYGVVLVDNLCNSSLQVVHQIEKITQKKVCFYQGDLLDRALLRQVFQEHQIGTVIHLAGHKSVPESMKMPMKYYKNNVGSTLTLLQTMVEFNCLRLIFSSSYCVYTAAPTPLDETMPIVRGANPYGNTKIINEMLLDDMALNGLNALCLRYFNPLGAHESGLIGEPLEHSTGIMPSIINVANGTAADPFVHITTNAAGQTAIRDFVHVVDLAQAHICALRYLWTTTGKNEKINLGSERETAILELVQTFAQVNGLTIPYQLGPGRPGDVFKIVSNSAKALALLGWKTERSVEDMCRSAWNYVLKNKTI